jgi:hypothetical protein
MSKNIQTLKWPQIAIFYKAHPKNSNENILVKASIVYILLLKCKRIFYCMTVECYWKSIHRHSGTLYATRWLINALYSQRQRCFPLNACTKLRQALRVTSNVYWPQFWLHACIKCIAFNDHCIHAVLSLH